MRHYLGISASGSTVYRNIRTDETGEPLLLIDEGVTQRLLVDFSDWLETGETIASVTATGNGCTVTASTSSPQTTLTISNVNNHHDGDITLIATSSTGEVFRQVIRVRRTNRYKDEALVLSDYV